MPLELTTGIAGGNAQVINWNIGTVNENERGLLQLSLIELCPFLAQRGYIITVRVWLFYVNRSTLQAAQTLKRQ